ncbi:hypothetical protein P5V15_013203 [Pogonomyrmex californicus]
MSTKSSSSPAKVCSFCNLSDDNELEYGKIYEHNGVVTHYYCLLLSSNMEQKGKDDEGILGFLTEDIQKELRRGKRLVCSYCKKIGATLGCCNVRCKRIFHFPCGLKAGSLHQFFGEFRSYCINHRPKQKIDDKILKQICSVDNVLCYICYDKVNTDDFIKTLWAPCCKKDAWFHRNCVQQLASSAGYFFKCPLCNNKKDFQKAMLEYGIFVPSQDASWELVPNAFEELLYRHNQCDAVKCLCPKGRKYTSNNAKWELSLCRTCGSQGVHMACGQLKWANPVWECDECTSILRNAQNNEYAKLASSIIDGSGRDSDPDLDSDSNSDSDLDSDTDISVGTEFPMSCPLPTFNSSSTSSKINLDESVLLRPGPRSFKLQQQINKLRLELTNAKKNITIEANLEDTQNKSSSNNDNEKKEPSTSKENTPQQKCKENILQQKSKNSSSEEDKLSNNNEKSQLTRQETDVITIESDDDEVEFITLQQKKDLSSSSLVQQSDDSPILCTSPSKQLLKTSLDDSAIFKNQNTAITNLSKNNIQSNSESESETSNKNKSIILNESDVEAPRESTIDLFSSNSNDLEEMNAIDTNEMPVMNIKITNVTSLPPEVFESVPDIVCVNTASCKDTTNISSLSTNKTLEQFVTSSSTKRSMHEEANDVTNNCKKIKGNNFDKGMQTGAVTCNVIVAPSTNTQQQSSTSLHKMDDVRNTNRTGTCYLNGNNTIFNIQQGNEKAQGNTAKYISFVKNNQLYMQSPSTDKFYLQQMSNPNIAVDSSAGKVDNGNTCVISSSSVNLSQMTDSTIVLNNLDNHNMFVNQSKMTKVTTSVNNNETRVLNEQGIVLTANLSAGTPSLGNNSSSSTAHCDGDAGTSPAEIASEKDDSTSDSHRSVVGDQNIAFQNTTYSVFPRVTNNLNTCHQPRLIPRYVNLHDLKFRVSESNNVQMILYDTFSVNIPTKNPKKNKNQSADILISRELKRSSTIASRTRDEASCSSDYVDSTSIEEQCFDKLRFSKNDNFLINDKSTCVNYVARDCDDAKENLDPIKSKMLRTNNFGNVNLTNSIDDTASTSDHSCDENDSETCLVFSDNLSVNRTICNTNVDTNDVTHVSNDCQSSQVNLESVQQYKQTYGHSVIPVEERSSARLFCKETNRIVHSVDFDLDVVKMNKNVEKVSQDDVTISTNRHSDDKIDNNHTHDSPTLQNGYKHLDNMHVMRPRVNNREISNITRFNEHSILNKQIDTCNKKFIRCTAFQENTVYHNNEISTKYNNDSGLKVSVDLCKIQNLIDSKPELFVNRDHDINNQRRKRTNRLNGREDYARQQVRYYNIEKSDTIGQFKNRELQKSSYTYNVEHMQVRDGLSGTSTFQYQKVNQGIRCFDKHILDR